MAIKAIYKFLLLLIALCSCCLQQSAVRGACENHCSGHGWCTEQDVCACFDGWGTGLDALSTGDCSERVCPFDIAWVDTPNQYGEFHKYLECSGRGICDRDLGECVCFEGYEGQGCFRNTCPNDCSGHGNCEYIEDIGLTGTWNEHFDRKLKAEKAARFEYPDWGLKKHRACVCDPHYGDFDCSKRMCPFGTDVLDVDDNLLVENIHTQTIQFIMPNRVVDGGSGTANDYSYNDKRTFGIVFKTQLNETFKTIPIVFDSASSASNYGSIDMARDIQVALLTLPNRVIDGVQVSCAWDFTNAANYDKLACTVRFTGQSVQGRQHLLAIDIFKCGDGCSPRLTGIWLDTLIRVYNNARSLDPVPKVSETVMSDYNSFECGRRGKCDYDTGICHCFTGYTGVNCNTQIALV